MCWGTTSMTGIFLIEYEKFVVIEYNNKAVDVCYVINKFGWG